MGRNSTNNDNSAVGAEFASVVSPNGFSTGDLVYRSSTGYGVMPTGGVPNGTYPLSAAVPQTDPTSLAVGTTVSMGISGGFKDQCATKLSNGNIVIAMRRNNNASPQLFPAFRIIDENNTVIVSDTIVGTNYTSLGSPAYTGVATLTGGGFVIYYTQDSGGTSGRGWAIYDNNGALTFGPFTDTAFTQYNAAGTLYQLLPRPDGRFVFMTQANTTALYWRIYNSNGSAYNAWQSGFGNKVYGDFCVFSDNTMLFVNVNSGFTNITWERWNAAGTAQVNSGTISAGTTLIRNIVVSKLAADEAAIYYYNDALARIVHRKFTSPSTLSSEVQVTAQSNVSGTGSGLSCSTISGTDNNLLCYSISGTATNYGFLRYCIVNGSTGTVISGPTIVSNWGAIMNNNTTVTIPVTGYLRVYGRGCTVSNINDMQAGVTMYMDIDSNTYATRVFNTVSASLGTTSVANGGYVKGSSTPASAVFTAASSSTPTVSISSGSVLVGPQVVTTSACDSFQLIKLANGGFLALYQISSSGAIQFTVYDINGVAGATYSVGTGSVGLFNGARGCQLSNGNIAIAYHTSASAAAISLYNSSYSLVTTTTFTANLGGATGAQGRVLSICPTTYDSRFVIGYTDNSAYPNFRVINGTTLATIANGSPTSTTVNNVSVVSTLDNGFILLQFQTSTSNVRWDHYSLSIPNSTTTYYQTRNDTYSPGTTVATLYNTQLTVSPNGQVALYGVFSANQVVLFLVSSAYSAYSSVHTISGTTSGNASCLSFAYSTNGYFCLLDINRSSIFRFIGTYSDNTTISNTITTISNGPAGTLTSTLTKLNATMIPLWGPYMVAGGLNTSNQPAFSIVAISDYSVTASITAGVSQSNPVTIDTSNGFSLIGVAASDCAAGGAGQVQTKGTAVLSSSYPTTTQTFDFTNPVTYGVKGTVSNRVITLED